ncbi:MAG TPA: DUF4214 domain-containing protein [Telluria sp.]|nr:DUF4214 domain-containing protein [Telluria sp.]
MAVSYARAVQALYVEYFGRPADPGGLAYWAGVLERGHGDASALRAEFSGSTEYKSTYGGLDAAATVNEMYRHLFGREAEPGGLVYWADALATGKVGVDLLLETVAGSAQGADMKVLSAKVDVAGRYTEAMAAGGATSYSDQQIAAARGMLATVVDPSSAMRAMFAIGPSLSATGTDGDDTFYLPKRPAPHEPVSFNGGGGQDTLYLNFSASQVGLAWPGDTVPQRLTFSLPDSTISQHDSADWSTPAYVAIEGVESFMLRNGQVLSRADLDLVLSKLRPMQLATLAEGLYQAGFSDQAIGDGLAVIRGSGGADNMKLTAQAAYLFGDAGDDQFVAGVDAERSPHIVFGGLGVNSIDYSAASERLVVESGYSANGALQNWTSKAQVRNAGAIDQLYNIDQLTGSAYGDLFFLDSSSMLHEIDGGGGQDSASINIPLAMLDISDDGPFGLRVNSTYYTNVETFTTADGFTLAASDIMKAAGGVYANRVDVVERMLDMNLPIASSQYQIQRGTAAGDTFALGAQATLYFGGAGIDHFVAGSGKEQVSHYLMGGTDLGNSVSDAAAASGIVYANTWYSGQDYKVMGLRTVVNGNSVDYLSYVNRITGSAFDDRFYVALSDSPQDNPSMIDGGAGIDTLVLTASFETHDIYKTASGGLRYGDLAEVRDIERIVNSAGLTASMADLLKALDTFDGGHARLDDVFKKMQELGMTVTQDHEHHGLAPVVGVPPPEVA